MAVSRRGFLHHGVLAAAVCWAKPLLALGSRHTVDGSGNNDDTSTPPRLPSSGSSANWQDHTAALQGMSRNQFAGAVGTDFKIVFPEGTVAPVWLTLMAVADLPALAPANPQSFAVPMRQSSAVPATNGYLLTFGSTADLAQGSYLFEHETLGKFALFTVPSGQQVYTAVINQLSTPTIIAVPFQTGNGAGSTMKIVAPTGAVTASPATSLEIGNPSPELSRIQGVRRGALRD